jgi:hypothetical protein
VVRLAVGVPLFVGADTLLGPEKTSLRWLARLGWLWCGCCFFGWPICGFHAKPGFLFQVKTSVEVFGGALGLLVVWWGCQVLVVC